MTRAGVATPGVSARIVICLGLSQIVAWGTMHYLVALIAAPMAQELAWSVAFVQGGFALALLVMGLASRAVGRRIDRHGGRAVLIAGCCLGAAGCTLLAVTQHAWQFVAAWVLLGLGMRMALYDAAFATLAHVGGSGAQRAMAQITLFGGFASTVFWPLGGQLVASFGWRATLGCYAVLLLATCALHLVLPRGHGTHASAASPAADDGPLVPPPRTTALLYAVIAVVVMVLQTGMAAHFLALLQARGWDLQTATTWSMLLGVGQVAGRAAVVVWGRSIDPVRLNLLPALLQCLCFVLYLASGASAWGAAAFAFLYGAGNGIATITRGAMPLVLFDPRSYGSTVGQLLKPAFVLSAAAPVVFALVITHGGPQALVAGALLLALTVLAAAVQLWQIHRRRLSP